MKMTKLLLTALLALLLAAPAAAMPCCGGARRPAGGLPCAPEEPGPCFAFGCYVGDATADRTIALTPAFEPDLVFVKRRSFIDGAAGLFKTNTMAADVSYRVAPGDATVFSAGIRAFVPTGFTVGNDFETNNSGVTYCYYAFQEAAGFLEIGTYTGDTVDGRQIAVTFEPELVLLYGITSDMGMREKTAELTGDGIRRLDGTGLFDIELDQIQALNAGGFEVGTGSNASTIPYVWIAWNDNAGWFYHGSFVGDGADGDNSTRTIPSGCLGNTPMVSTFADTGGLPSNIRFLCTYIFHENVTGVSAQRFNATDVAGPADGQNGGLKSLGALDFDIGQGTSTIMHGCNITGSTYYYWGVCGVCTE